MTVAEELIYALSVENMAAGEAYACLLPQLTCVADAAKLHLGSAGWNYCLLRGNRFFDAL